MEIKKIIIILLSLALSSCDTVTYVSIYNDTKYFVEVITKKEILISPDENGRIFSLIGGIPPRHFVEENIEKIVNIFNRAGFENGLCITYLEANYQILPNEIVRLITYNSTFNQNLGAYIYTVNLSEILELCKYDKFNTLSHLATINVTKGQTTEVLSNRMND